MLLRANYRNILLADVYRCRGFGYLALVAADRDSRQVPQEETISPHVQRCTECGARNFKREICHACGQKITD